MCRRTRVRDEALLCLHSVFGMLMMCLAGSDTAGSGPLLA